MGGWVQKGWVQKGWVREALPFVRTLVCLDLIFRGNPFLVDDLVTNDGVEEHDLVARTDPQSIDFIFEKFPNQ